MLKLWYMNLSVKEILKSEELLAHPGDVGHYEKTKSKKNRDRGRKKTPTQRPRKYFQQNQRKFPNLRM